MGLEVDKGSGVTSGFLACLTPNKMPPVTNASPASKFQCMGSPKNHTAPKADKPGTNAVIMVERTGP
jgi:hypothetical protein